MGGFRVGNSEIFRELYCCSACGLVLREPYQLPCSHRQCQTCLRFGEKDTIQCLECGTEAPKHEVKLDRGCKNDMKLLSVNCSSCEWTGMFRDYEKHQNQVHANLTDAQNEEGSSAPRLIVGNNARSVATHGSCLDLHRANGSFNDENDPIQQNTVPELVDHNASETSNTHDENALEMEMTAAPALATPVLPATVETNTHMVQEIMNVLGEQIRNLNVSRDYLHQQITQMRQALASTVNEIMTIRTSYEEQTVLINGNRSNGMVQRQTLAPLQQAVDEKQHTSYDGTLVWKITDVREKIADAQAERQKSIYSPPFYSSPNGYKMGVRLFLNGEGSARRTHMSIFFILMRGPHDAILEFPFTYKITFCLFDLATHEKHMIESFCPDVQSNSFQRPRSENNIPIGLSKFCPLQLIEVKESPYIQDNTMFIRVALDFRDLPKSLLAYDAQLNPGFPMHVRQMEMNKEIERRTGGQRASTTTPDTQTSLSCEVIDVDDI